MDDKSATEPKQQATTTINVRTSYNRPYNIYLLKCMEYQGRALLLIVVKEPHQAQIQP